ncbi:MAG TPA: nitronate monooxygenase [Longimicrobiales bacterium]|nr:nitronate monooxygenase [Longimicrobiales bacterium]
MIIQGGMGVGISGWSLAHAVAQCGQLGVVSGTAMDACLVRRLGDGDPGGHYRRALEAFPIPGVAKEILDWFFRPEGRGADEGYKPLAMHKRALSLKQFKTIVAANFAEVWLAKEGHDGEVGVNLLTKIQIPNISSLYGAMLAGVDYVLMGAGIPKEIPGCLDRLARHESAEIRLEVIGGTGAPDESTRFDPISVWGGNAPIPLTRPNFLPIVASNSLATMLAKKSTGSIQGFIVEGPTAGGHNAPPRGPKTYNERGEPLYGDRDAVDLSKLAELGLPFWIAGGAGSPDHLRAALDDGAAGVQVGTLFAYCEESGLRPDLKAQVLEMSRQAPVDVRTDERASPTGFPFKVVDVPDSLSCGKTYEKRGRVCDLGYLRSPYRRDDGRIEYRCASEPVDTFVKKGGDVDDTVGRKCLCNALMANIGLGQRRDGGVEELPLLTSGDDLRLLGQFMGCRTSYSAQDVVAHLLAGVTAAAPAGST